MCCKLNPHWHMFSVFSWTVVVTSVSLFCKSLNYNNNQVTFTAWDIHLQRLSSHHLVNHSLSSDLRYTPCSDIIPGAYEKPPLISSWLYRITFTLSCCYQFLMHISTYCNFIIRVMIIYQFVPPCVNDTSPAILHSYVHQSNVTETASLSQKKIYWSCHYVLRWQAAYLSSYTNHPQLLLQRWQ